MSGFSATRLWASVMGGIVSMGASIGIAPKPPEPAKPDPRIAAQQPDLERAADALEELRGDICTRLDRRALVVLPLVALGVVVLLVALYGGRVLTWGLLNTGLLVLIAVALAWLLLQRGPARVFRQTMRAILGRSIASALGGFTHQLDPAISHDTLRDWPLFPRITEVTGHDLLTGTIHGQDVSIARLHVDYHIRTRRERNRRIAQPLHAICIRIDAGLPRHVSAVFLPDMIDRQIHRAITKTHGLEDHTLPADLARHFQAYVAPDSHTVLQMLDHDALAAIGENDPAIVVFHAGQTIALFPLGSDIFVPLAPQPYWREIDRAELLAQLNDDLRIFERRLARLSATCQG